MENKYKEMQQVKKIHDQLLNMHLDSIRLHQAGFPIPNFAKSLEYYKSRLSGLGEPVVIRKRDTRVRMVFWFKNFVVRLFKKFNG